MNKRTRRDYGPAGQCCYTVDGLQCPAPAVMARYPRGGLWYCSQHAHCTSPKTGRAIIDYYESHGLPGPKPDWRDTLLNETMAQIRARQKAHQQGGSNGQQNR